MQTGISLKFQLSLSRSHFRECTAQYYHDLSPHSDCQSTDSNPLFHGIMLNPFSTRFLETAMLHILSKVYQYALEKISYLEYIMQNTPNLDKPLPLNSFVVHRNFNFRINWNTFVMVFSKLLSSLWKSCMNFSQTQTSFRHIEITCFLVVPPNLCSFLTFDRVMNKILKWFMTLIQQTWFKWSIYFIW